MRVLMASSVRKACFRYSFIVSFYWTKIHRSLRNILSMSILKTNFPWVSIRHIEPLAMNIHSGHISHRKARDLHVLFVMGCVCWIISLLHHRFSFFTIFFICFQQRYIRLVRGILIPNLIGYLLMESKGTGKVPACL